MYLDHADLAVRHGDQTFIHQLVVDWITWLPLHYVIFRFLISQGDRGHLLGNKRTN